LRRYEKIEDELRKERAKNTQQYSQILELMGEKEELKVEIENLINGEEKTKILSELVDELKQKNRSFEVEIEAMKAREAGARRKCGQIFLKSLSQAQSGESSFKVEESNLFDDDAIINLYQLLK
jgi:acyl-homoserine lactone acylase PvdQ